MKKRIILLITILLAAISIAGYLFLTKEIILGHLKIADGQKQLADGEQTLERGEAKLASGNKRLSRAKNSYSKFKTVPFYAVAALPVAGQIIALTGDKIAGQKIAEGNRLVAQGANKVKAGEDRLAEGKLQLAQGTDKLALANKIRIACGITAIFFSLLSFALGFYWRRSWRK
ncbi:MAG: hypothetical protein ABI597_04305 [Gammaproteobacteria bacterium]